MPATSIAQQHLFQAAEHGADFPMAEKLRDTMTHDQMHDFAAGSMAGKPTHVGVAPAPATPPLLGGDSNDVIGANVKSFKSTGQSEFDATRSALKAAKPSLHKNLGKFLHPRKDGKPHGSGSF